MSKKIGLDLDVCNLRNEIYDKRKILRRLRNNI